jgi:hypothetical protein
MTTNNERVRFGNNKNTLYTIKEDETIYFGISRCNSDSPDIFNKKMGRLIARGRAALAQAEWNQTSNGSGPPFQLVADDKAGLRGAVSVTDVDQLLQYFSVIDEFAYDEFAGVNIKKRLVERRAGACSPEPGMSDGCCGRCAGHSVQLGQ